MMTTKSLKKLAELLHRSEGISLTPIIVIMVIMSVMGGVFTSIMGGWKVSAPLTVNSNKAFFQAESAAMFALQDAQYRFYSKDVGSNDMFNFGTSTAVPYVVSSVTTGNMTQEADYWFERPDANDDGPHDDNDDNVDDDDDDSTDPTRYTIIATGTVKIGGTTLAKRQIKILADIIPSAANTIAPGVHTSGDIIGTGLPGSGFGMIHNADTTEFIGGPANTDNPPGSGAAIVDSSMPSVNVIDKHFVEALAIDQGHVNAGNFTISAPDYPTSSFYYYYNSSTDNMPNFTYVSGNLHVSAGSNANGVIWVTGDVTLTNTLTNNAIIFCDGNIDFVGSSSKINGSIINYGTLITGNANANAIIVNDLFFNALNAAIPDITVASWQEAVSEN